MTHDEKERLLLSLMPNIRAAGRSFARRSGYPADDMVQEACIAVWVGLENYDPLLSSVRTFADRCIYWRLLTYWRKAHDKRRFPETRPAELPTEVQDYRGSECRSSLEFEELIQCCRPRDAEVLRLQFAEGLTQDEIGEQQGCSHQAINQCKRRALTTIRAQLLKLK